MTESTEAPAAGDRGTAGTAGTADTDLLLLDTASVYFGAFGGGFTA